METLSPFVYWAQSEEFVFLKVDLTDATNTDVKLKERELGFQAKGLGAKGLNNYKFSIDFHSNINTEESNFKVNDGRVDILIAKETKGWWPRLISQPQKPAWLKIDFDKWQSEEDKDLDAYEKLRDIREDYRELYNQLQKDELGYSKEEIKKVYLGFYNFFMFIFFLYILIIMVVNYMKNGVKSFNSAYETVGSTLTYATTVQFLELFHVILGYTSGSFLTSFIQIGGRMTVLKLVIGSEPALQTYPEIFYLFFVWSLVEVIRYPFYITQIYKKEIRSLTWLRYSAWILLYPIGLITEVVILYKSIPFYEKSLRYSIQLPNSLNYSFYLYIFIRVYLLFFAFPVMYLLISHMYRARRKKLGSKKVN